MLFTSFLHLLLCVAVPIYAVSSNATQKERLVKDFFDKSPSGSTHTNNWAVLVCSSRYWFNYRHMANALGMYRTVKRLGIPDSNIILMLADDASCNSRNSFPGSVYANPGRHLDLYGDNIEVDYRGYEVTVENFIRVLTGRMDDSVPRSKRLLSDEKSNVFVYMTGHGGAEFLKFQDNEEISAFDLADAFEQMYQKKRYNEMFFMIDTCQANTMHSKLYSPNIFAIGSSRLGESSYSHSHDHDIGIAVIDSFTHYVLEFMEKINKTSTISMEELFGSIDPVKINSHPGVRNDLFKRPLDQTRITDFFGGVSQVEVLGQSPASNYVSVGQATPESELPPIPDRLPSVSTPATSTLSSTDAIVLKAQAWLGEFKAARSWISAFLLVSLFGWIAVQK